jgi:hypothetical protein
MSVPHVVLDSGKKLCSLLEEGVARIFSWDAEHLQDCFFASNRGYRPGAKPFWQPTCPCPLPSLFPAPFPQY